MSFLGRGKVHWSKTTYQGDQRRTKHYREEELYFDDIMPLFGSGEKTGNVFTTPAGIGKPMRDAGIAHFTTKPRIILVYKAATCRIV